MDVLAHSHCLPQNANTPPTHRSDHCRVRIESENIGLNVNSHSGVKRIAPALKAPILTVKSAMCRLKFKVKLSKIFLKK